MRRNPIYELPPGIKVYAEYPSGGSVNCLIEAHPLFPHSKVYPAGKQVVAKSRLIMTSVLKRPLELREHVHHIDRNHMNNDLDNLQLIDQFDHNSHHKSGSKHSQKTKDKIAETLRYNWARGLMPRSDQSGPNNPFFGKKHTPETRAKMSAARRSRNC